MLRSEYLLKFKFRVFPCKANEKRPAISDWRNQAKVKNTITGNYGVLASGHPYAGKTIVVVDLDNHSEKEESGVQFWEKNDFPADTFTVETPSGGKHLYYLASQEQIKEIGAIGGFKLHPQIDFFWQDNHYILGVGSVVNGKEYKVINENEPSDLPECVIGLLKGFNGFRERPMQDAEKPRERKKSKSRLHEYERELILRELEKQKSRFGECKEDRGFYDEWFRLACSLKNLGFDVEDFQRLSYDDEETQRECIEVWNSINREERGIGSLIYDGYLPEWNNIKWRFDKLEDIAIEKAINMFPNLHILEVGKDVCIIDDEHIEKSTLKDYRNTYAIYKKKQHRIDYPERTTAKFIDEDGNEKTRQTVIFKEKDAFPIFFDNSECLKGRITDPNLPYGVVEIKGKRFFNDFERVNLVEGEGTYDLFFDHLKNNVCNGDETSFNYLKMWIFSVLLYKRPKTAICLTGNQGVGKSIVGQILSMAFCPRYSTTINSTETLSNRFDFAYKRCFLCLVEEAMFSSSKYKNVWAKLKDCITSDTTSIERKGFDMEKIDNKTNWIITSNDPHIAPVEKNNRRWVVFKVNDNHRLDVEYFRKMTSALREGGMAKLVREAEAHREEVVNFNFQNIPENEASLQNMVETAPSMLQWLLSKLEEFSPEEGYDDMPFIEQDGEVLINANDLIDIYCSDTREDKRYYTSKKVSGWLKDWTGKETEKRDYDGHKNLRCLCFRSVSDLIRSISATYFGGKNPLKIDI